MSKNRINLFNKEDSMKNIILVSENSKALTLTDIDVKFKLFINI